MSKRITTRMVDAVLDACDPGRPSPALRDLRDLLDKHDAWVRIVQCERLGIVEGSGAWYVVRADDSGDCDSRRCASEAEARIWLERWT